MEANDESVFLKVKNLKKIKKQFDEFLRVKVLKERKLYRDVTKTKVKIEKVYKSFDHRKENEKRSYLPSTTKYSIYPVKNCKQKEILSQKKLDNGEYSYGKIKNYYILTTRLEELKQYMENKKELNHI